MRDWTFAQVLGLAIAYGVVALLVVMRHGRAHAKATTEAYQREHNIGANDDYLVTITTPAWYIPVVFIPPAALIGYWVVARLMG